MTTAGRPTYNAAMGRQSYGGIVTTRLSGKDQIAHTKIKYRQVGQSSTVELKTHDFRAELEKRERNALEEKQKLIASAPAIPSSEHSKKDNTPKLLLSADDTTEVLKKYNDGDAEFAKGDSDKDLDSSDDESDDEDSDDEAELQAELERIKAERASVAAKKDKEEKEMEELENRQRALKGNPLLNSAADDSKIKRRWNDDVVFRNQARDEPEHKKRFVNDTIRNDFHRNFLRKFIK